VTTTPPAPQATPAALAPECPATVSEQVELLREDLTPAWVNSLGVKPCAAFRGLCQADGGVVMEDVEAWRVHRLIDADGHAVEEWRDGHDTRRRHIETRWGRDCVVERIDTENDGLIDVVCTRRGPTPGPATCEQFQRSLTAGTPCDAGCAGTLRCRCDESGRPVERIDDSTHRRTVTTYTGLDGGHWVSAQSFRGDLPVGEAVRTLFDDRERIITRIFGDSVMTYDLTREGITIQTDGTLDGGLITRTTIDTSVPGERIQRIEAATGHGWLTRTKGDVSITVMFAPPAVEAWYVCARDTDCAVRISPCQCGPTIAMNKRFMPKMPRDTSTSCACPALALSADARPLIGRCTLNLCTVARSEK